MNKIFSNKTSNKNVPVANAINSSGSKAYNRSSETALAQLVLTGTFNGTFYTSEKDQLDKVLSLATECDPTFVAKLAVYARKNGYMKDTPAVLAAYLSTANKDLLKKIFSRVVDNPKMARNFVQVLRSGSVGRKSLGSLPKRLIQDYLNKMDAEQLFKADVGNSPSLQDIIKMVHPRPKSKEQEAMFAYLIGKEKKDFKLPEFIIEYEKFKKNSSGALPKNIPFNMLTSLPLTDKQWKELAEGMSWQQLRQSLNTLSRHKVFDDEAIVKKVAAKLSDPNEVKRAKVFPYQIYSAFINVEDVPMKIKNALQDAAEHAIDNIPSIDGKIYLFPDVSGSMKSPVTGYRGSVTTKMRCVDVAALMAASLLRKNPEAVVIPFDTRVHTPNLNPRDSIMTNAQKLAQYGGGGTDCHLPMNYINNKGAKGDLVVYVSDNESWVDAGHHGRGTATMDEWKKFKNRNPKARLVCIDITPSSTSQVKDRDDVLNVGGFSDQVFNVIHSFLEEGKNNKSWVKEIEAVEL